MKIVVDTMGGDKDVVKINVEGSVLALKENPNIEVILVGPKEQIEKELSKYKKLYIKEVNRISIVNTKEHISMEDQPSKILRTKINSSIGVGIRLLKDNKADAFVSAGNSGAIMAFAVTQLGRIKYVSRPAIAAVLPTIRTPCVVLDVGANVDCKPQQLLEFAYMGHVYCKNILSIKDPKVSILSIGTEETKGNSQVLETYSLLKNSGLNFIGNIEGKDIPFGVADVVVTDGFIGNIVLKLAEGVAEMLLTLIKYSLKKYPLAWFSIPFVWNAIKDIRKNIDFAEYGGAPLVGLEKVCIICHGRSTSKAIKNAIRVAKEMVEKEINSEISKYMEQISEKSN
ncbi:MAG: phosphate acyltransferase PlsX [Endomicrobia bacterium]|nr:phosphate acyltransferase PlsX [Endomicrobiia bacterium]